MSKVKSSNKIYISQSKIANAGRGVFAGVNIKKGEIIESCPVIEILKRDSENINLSMLVTYIYYLGKNKERMIVALGFGSIYNHTFQPNAKYKEKYKEKVIDFIALNKIKKIDEITVNYSQGNHKDKNPLWFNANL